MKQQLLKYFKDNPESYVSGEMLSELFGVTRASIWKVVKQLEKDGFRFESKTKLGYRLIYSPDIPYDWELAPLIKGDIIGKKLIYRKEVDSTNDLAKKLANDGAEEGTVVIASSQTGGRARKHGKWEDRNGIYMSLILRPKINLEKTAELLSLIIEIIRGTIENELLVNVKSNGSDIYLNDKKICGILSEFSGETDEIEFIIIGIGIVTNKIEDVVGAGVDKRLLISSILNFLDKEYLSFV